MTEELWDASLIPSPLRVVQQARTGYQRLRERMPSTISGGSDLHVQKRRKFASVGEAETQRRLRLRNRSCSGQSKDAIAASKHELLASDSLEANNAESNAITGAVLRAAQEEQSDYITVDIGCTAHANSCLNMPLDLVIILDNSLFSSPATLMASCTAASFLSSLLDPNRDRLAILDTGDSTRRFTSVQVLLPMSSHNIHDIKAALDMAEVCTSFCPENDYLQKALRIAQTIMAEASQSIKEKDVISQVSRHIVAFTANPSGISLEGIHNDWVQLNVICPAIVAWEGDSRPRINGWYLNATRDNFLCHTGHSEKNGMQKGLMAMMAHCRSGCSPSTVMKASLTFGSVGLFAFDVVLGLTEIPQLFPGETQSLLIKITRAREERPGSSLERFPAGLRTLSGNVDLEGELENILGEQERYAFCIDLRYQHSALPPGTICELHKEVRISPRTAVLNNFDHSCGDGAGSTIQPASVQWHLAHHIATHQSPRRALIALNKQWRINNNSPDSIDRTIALIAEELKYQGRVLERFDMASARKLVLGRPLSYAATGSNSSLADPEADSRAPSAGRFPRLRSVSAATEALKDILASVPSHENVQLGRKSWLHMRHSTRDPNSLPRVEINGKSTNDEKEAIPRNKSRIGRALFYTMANNKRMSENIMPRRC